MKTKKEILELFFNSKEVKQETRKINVEVRDDLVQECSIILLLKPETEIQLAYYRETLLSLFKAICYRQLTQSGSKFNRLYTAKGLTYEEMPDVSDLEIGEETLKERIVRERMEEDALLKHYQAEDLAKDEIDKGKQKLSIYERDIINAYEKFGSYRLTGAAFEMPWKTVYNDVKKAKTKLDVIIKQNRVTQQMEW